MNLFLNEERIDITQSRMAEENDIAAYIPLRSS